MNWQALPFVRLLAPLLTGIVVIDRYFDREVSEVLPLVLAVSLILLWVLHACFRTFRFRPFLGLLLLLAWTAMGALVVQEQHPLRRDHHFAKHWEESSCLVGVVRSVRTGTSHHRYRVDVEGVRSEKGSWRKVSGRMLVYLPDSLAARGDTLLWKGRLQRIPPPLNPEAFDFAGYMERQYVFHQSFIRSGNYRIFPYRGGGGLTAWAARAQSRGLRILADYLPEEDAYAVAAALVLGHREALDTGLREAYAISGAMHILAVSGLHVGLVYLLLSRMLRIIPVRPSHRRWFEMILQLGGIWGFVLVAGLPASAVRAATMFSFFTLGRTLYRQASIYNILAASAFCMLLWNPQQLFQVGFQLSFSAVFGIIAWHDRIYRSWHPPSRLLDYGWKLICVSLAAQMATFPLGVYYFNQFPVFFWLSGLIAVPAAGLILGGGLILLLLEPIGPLAACAGSLLRHLLDAVNSSIRWISELPLSRLHGLWIEEREVVLLYFFMVLFSLATSVWAHSGKRQGKLWLAALTVLLILTWSRAFGLWQRINQRQIVIYYVSGNTLLDIVDEAGCRSITGAGLSAEKVSYAAQRYRWSRKVDPASSLLLTDIGEGRGWRYRAGLLQFYDRKLLVLGPEDHPAHLPAMNADVVLIRGNPNWTVFDLQERISASLIVLDASNSFDTARAWRLQCRKAGINFHSVRSQGALVIPVSDVK